jgi:Ca2+-binding EF-hand superfamily protein
VLPDASESRLDFESLRKRFDRDGDGAIDRSEVPSRLHPAFDRLDRDGDGRVTREDFPR